MSNSESVQCNFFMFDHVTFIQFKIIIIIIRQLIRCRNMSIKSLQGHYKICCCVQNFIEIGWVFAEIWRYNDFQSGSHPPSWNCFTTIRDLPRSLCCWLQLPVKFHVNLVHRSEDIAIWIFRIFGLKCLFRPPKCGFWGTLDLWMWLFIIETPVAHPCVNPRVLSYQL